MNAAVIACEAEIINRIEKDNLLNKAVYHAARLITYLAYRAKSSDKYVYNLAFERVFEITDKAVISILYSYNFILETTIRPR